jgi:hypothetical protein
LILNTSNIILILLIFEKNNIKVFSRILNRNKIKSNKKIKILKIIKIIGDK